MRSISPACAHAADHAVRTRDRSAASRPRSASAPAALCGPPGDAPAAGGPLLPLSAPPRQTDRLLALPPALLDHMAGFLEREERVCIVGSASRAQHRAMAASTDGLLRDLLAAHCAQDAIAAQAAAQAIRKERALRAPWEHSLRQQVQSVRKDWDLKCWACTTGAWAANVLARVGDYAQAIAIMRWSIAHVPAPGR